MAQLRFLDMLLLLLLLLLLLSPFNQYCIAIETKYYPIYGTQIPFELNLKDEDITYGSALPSVTALDENIFAVSWASSSPNANVEYNENIHCRLFEINETSKTEPVKLVFHGIIVNKLSDRHQYNPQIVALSDRNNVITDSKQFAVVWHSDDLDGNFDGIYLKIFNWYKEENDIIRIDSDDITKQETKVNDISLSIIGHPQITPIFDANYFIISWISRQVNGHIFTYNIYAKLFDNNGNPMSEEYYLIKESSMKQYQLSLTPIYLSSKETQIPQRSTYLIITWSVFDPYISGVSSIYSKLLDVGNKNEADFEISKKDVINETVMDNGINIFKWKISDNKYNNQYINNEPDSTYLMNNYLIIVWSSIISSKDIYSQIHAAIYYIKWTDSNQTKATFINVYDKFVFNDTLHGNTGNMGNNIGNYQNPKVDTITCYQSNIDYKNRSKDKEIIKDVCDISICYQFTQIDTNSLSKSLCSFWKITKEGDLYNDITMQRYYNNDIEITQQLDNTYYPESCSWDRFYYDNSSPLSAKLLIIDQIGNEYIGHSIYGRMIKYGNWSLENPPNNISNQDNVRKEEHKNIMAVIFILVAIIFCIPVVFLCYYQKCKGSTRFGSISDEIAGVNKKLSKLNLRNKRKGYEMSGVDTDDDHDDNIIQDDDDDDDIVELGNDDDSRTAFQIAQNNMTKPKPINQKYSTKIKVQNVSSSSSPSPSIIDNNNNDNNVLTADLNTDDDDDSSED